MNQPELLVRFVRSRGKTNDLKKLSEDLTSNYNNWFCLITGQQILIVLLIQEMFFITIDLIK